MEIEINNIYLDIEVVGLSESTDESDSLQTQPNKLNKKASYITNSSTSNNTLIWKYGIQLLNSIPKEFNSLIYFKKTHELLLAILNI